MPPLSLAIIDAHNHLHRYHHMVPPEASLCYSWGSMVASLIRSLKLNGAVAVFDPLVKESKPGREPTPERIVRDQPDIQKICEMLGIGVVNPSEILEEGDQLIADLWHSVPDVVMGEVNLYIVSSDKDMAQLVGQRMFNDGTKVTTFQVRRESDDWKVYGPNGVREKWGVRPDQMVDWLVLVGDSTDNIPGVKGIGKKTAPLLLQTYGTLENLLLKSSGLSENEFLEKWAKDELVFSQCPGLSQKLADNLSDCLKFLPIRKAMIELTPRKVKIPPQWLGLCPQVVQITEIMRGLGKYNLSDMAAKMVEGRLWAKIAKNNS